MPFYLSLVLLALFASVPVIDEPMTDGDRRRLVAHLEMTESWLESEVAGLSRAQLTFRPSPTSWHIMDVVEHLAIAEPQYWDQLQKSIPTAPYTTKPETTDAAILWYGIDRTDRQTTGEARVPTGRWSEVGESLSAFRTLRQTMLGYARTSQDGLRARQLVDGNMDVYQWFLMISTHAQRHILQIREIKASPGYPR